MVQIEMQSCVFVVSEVDANMDACAPLPTSQQDSNPLQWPANERRCPWFTQIARDCALPSQITTQWRCIMQWRFVANFQFCLCKIVKLFVRDLHCGIDDHL